MIFNTWNSELDLKNWIENFTEIFSKKHLQQKYCKNITNKFANGFIGEPITTLPICTLCMF